MKRLSAPPLAALVVAALHLSAPATSQEAPPPPPPPAGQHQPYPEEARSLPWNGRPLSIELRPGRERIVFFPGRVRVRIPSALSQLLRTQIIHEAVYWTALDHFDTQRIVVHQEAPPGGTRARLYLVDLAATPKGAATPLRVRVVDEDAQEQRFEARALPANPPEMILTRFAAQRLYAPQRLLPKNEAIRRLPVHALGEDFPLLRGVLLRWRMLASWRGYGLHLTALQLENQTRQRLVLDARRLRGNWRAVTFHHRELHPADSPGDSTVAYLVSRRSFVDSLKEEPQWRDPPCCG